MKAGSTTCAPHTTTCHGKCVHGKCARKWRNPSAAVLDVFEPSTNWARGHRAVRRKSSRLLLTREEQRPRRTLLLSREHKSQLLTIPASCLRCAPRSQSDGDTSASSSRISRAGAEPRAGHATLHATRSPFLTTSNVGGGHVGWAEILSWCDASAFRERGLRIPTSVVGRPSTVVHVATRRTLVVAAT